ncbi:YgaP family membrane protein [Colwellia sp. MEBiC06753]
MSGTTVERAVFRFAGVMVLLSLALTYWVHPNFFWFTAFIGANMFQFSFTGFCPAAIFFKKLGLKTEAEAVKA